MSLWSDLIDAIATGREEPSIEDVNGHMTDRHVREWVESCGLSPMAIIGEALEEIDHGLDGRDRGEKHLEQLFNSVIASNPQPVTWRLLHDSLRRNAIRAALYEAECAREKERERREDEAHERGDYEYERRKQDELDRRES